MLLMGVDDFREAVSAPVNEDANKLITLALQQTASSLSALLPTPLDKVTGYTEYFRCACDDIYHQMKPLPVLLERGFVSQAVNPVVIKFADTFEGLADAEADTSAKIVNEERGVINVMRTMYPQKYMSVQYDAGFATTISEFGPIYVGVPAWLEALALRMGLEIYQSLRSWSSDKPLPMPTFSRTTMVMLEPKSRRMSGYLRGLNA